MNEATVLVRYDEDQTAECIIGYDAQRDATTVTYGPNPPDGIEHGEAALIHVLRSLVDPEGAK